MKKLLFLSVALAMCMMPLSSCSKDEGRRGPEANLESVDGTEWISKKATMRFRNGKYTIDCEVPGWGTYKQYGDHIVFDGNPVVIDASFTTPTNGEISKYGDSMNVLFQNAGSAQSVTFTYNILAD